MTTAALASMFLLVSGASCLRSTEFTCSTNAQCGAGTCEPDGYCSVADTACSTGRRYDSSAGTHVDQRTACAADGANVHLAVPDTMQELTAIIVAAEAGELWVGIHDQVTEGSYVTVLGQPQTFLPWDSGEPNNQGGGGGQDCVAVKSNVAKFLDETCTVARVAVCECAP